MTRIKTVSEISSALAHELNQPLAAVLSNAQAAKRFMRKDGWEPNEIQAIIDDIVRDDKRASNVIHQLRSMVAKTNLQVEPIGINQIIDEVALLLHSELVEHDIPIHLEICSILPEVTGNRVEIQQVLVNLMMNAVEVMVETAIPRKLLTIRTVLKGDWVVIAVTDNGPGIPADLIDSIFKPFSTSKSSGLGLGLSICSQIME